MQSPSTIDFIEKVFDQFTYHSDILKRIEPDGKLYLAVSDRLPNTICRSEMHTHLPSGQSHSTPSHLRLIATLAPSSHSFEHRTENPQRLSAFCLQVAPVTT
ncbi:MAG: hypothetical protein IPM54_31110 [Polyangiaceae bacterium]|nr:hypothetical protein [Polyangiaceae bacterium]